MLNKKAIAAFAAGATLLSGLAFAAPAFAKDEAKADQKTEKCTPGTTAEVLSATVDVDKDTKAVEAKKDTLREKKEALRTAQKALAGKQSTLDKAVAHAAAKKTAADNAKKAYDDAFSAYMLDDNITVASGTKGKDSFNADKDHGKKLFEDLKKANQAYYAADAAPAADAALTALADSLYKTVKTDEKAVNDYKENELAEAEQAVKDAQTDLDAAKKNLQDDKDYLDKLQCKGEKPAPKPNPVKPNPADPTPVTPGPVTPSVLPNVAQASGALMHTNVAYNEAAADYTTSVSELKDAQAKYDEAKAQLDSLEAQVKAANDNYQNNFKLAGKADTDAGKAANADLANAVNLRDAYKTHEFKAASDKLAEKKAKLDQAGKKLNAAKAQYANAYLTALRVEASAVKGFPDPRTLADAPVDVFSPEGKAAAGKLAAAAAQAGKAGAAAAANGAAAAAGAKAAAGENGGKKKNNAGENAKKKLGQTGATVALAAVAASVLAGVGAALRKIRH